MNRLPAVVAALLLGLLAGCVSPPDSGPIRPGAAGPIPDGPPPVVRPIANPPRPGMQPAEIVAGFLAASAAVGDDFDIARQYLTPDGAASWDPGAGVTLIAGDRPALNAAGATVTAQVAVIGSVSADGVYSEEPPTDRSLVFPTEQVGGEWRLAQAPPGLVLSRSAFGRAFVTGHAYFVDPSGTWTVPDARAVPRTGPEAQATALVSALLAGPSPWSSDSVITAIPTGLQLSLAAVPVSAGVARVELAGPEPLLDDRSASHFGAQLAWTLQQVPGVEAFEVLVAGRPLPLPVSGPIPLSDFDSFNPDVLPARAPLHGLTALGEPVEVTSGGLRPLVVGLDPATGAPALFASFAGSPAGGLLAGAARDSPGMLIGGRGVATQPMDRFDGPILGGPAIDGRDRVWWTDPEGGVVVAVPDSAGRYSASAVPVDGVAGVRTVRPARDGTRAVLNLGGEGRAVLAAIVEVPGGGIALRGAVPLGVADPALVAAWRSATEITVLLPGRGVVQRIDLLGGVSSAFSVPATARSITDAPAAALVVSLEDTASGPLTGDGIRPVPGLTQPAYPG